MLSRLSVAAVAAASATILLASCVRLPPDVVEAMSVASEGNHYAGAAAGCVTREGAAGRDGAKCEAPRAR